MKHAARLIPALLLWTLAAHAPEQNHPARPWWDNHVDPVRVGKDK